MLRSGCAATRIPTACVLLAPDYERRALEKGKIAVYSMLRDWIKGQVIAIETGMLSFEAAFLGQIMLPTGETVLERIERDNVLSLPAPTPAH